MADIFIADDDTLVIDLITFRLKRRGHTVRGCTDGEKALEEILEQPPDLIIMDYQLPVMNAPEVIHELKHRETTMNIPILILAAQWREKDVIEALGAGITDYMTKPFSPDELIFRINRALKSRGL